MANELVRFNYGAGRVWGWISLILCIVLSACMCLMIIFPGGKEYAHSAHFGDIPVYQARILWGTLGTICLVMGLLAFRRSRIKCIISLTTDALVFPKSNYFSQREISIPLDSVREVKLVRYYRSRTLTLFYDGGSIDIYGGGLPSKSDFDTFRRLLAERVNCDVPME